MLKSLRSTLVRKLLQRRLHMLAQSKQLYDSHISPADKASRQCDKFNEVWRYCHRNIPFYVQWRKEHDLPETIGSLEELKDFPVLDKNVIQSRSELVFRNAAPGRAISTGGSTGAPTRFPVGPQDGDLAYAVTYVGKSWWDINPLDDIAFLWGHSHLFGSGFRGRVNEWKRRLKDHLINISRFNAYDMSLDTLAGYHLDITKASPVALTGYTSCLYKLARHIESHSENRPYPRLKVVIPTAETIVDADIELMERVYGAPVAIEYGMAETGVIAYSRNTTKDIHVFWDSHICMTGQNGDLRVTTIGGQFFPLINYRTNDLVEVLQQEGPSILRLSAIKGRTRDVLLVRSSSGRSLSLSGILMVHLLKSYPGIYSIQFEQLERDGVRIRLSSDAPLDLGDIREYFFRELSKDHPDMDRSCFDFSQTDTVTRTTAGKERMII